MILRHASQEFVFPLCFQAWPSRLLCAYPAVRWEEPSPYLQCNMGTLTVPILVFTINLLSLKAQTWLIIHPVNNSHVSLVLVLPSALCTGISLHTSLAGPRAWGFISLRSHRDTSSYEEDSQGLFITLNTSPEFTQWETIKEHYCICLCGFPNRNINHGVSSWAEMHSRWRYGWRPHASCAYCMVFILT